MKDPPHVENRIKTNKLVLENTWILLIVNVKQFRKSKVYFYHGYEDAPSFRAGSQKWLNSPITFDCFSVLLLPLGSNHHNNHIHHRPQTTSRLGITWGQSEKVNKLSHLSACVWLESSEWQNIRMPHILRIYNASVINF